MDLQGNIVKNELHDKLRDLETEHGIKFSNTQKVLLSIEGSITAILDVLYYKVSIFPIKQECKTVSEEMAEKLQIGPDEKIHSREVLKLEFTARWEEKDRAL